jgi:tellurite resistance protein
MRIPPNLFGITFGAAGLAATWRAADPLIGGAGRVAAVLDVLAAVLWLVLVVAYLLQGPRQVLADLRHPVFAPFVAVPAITGMLLGAALAARWHAAGELVVIVFLTLTTVLGGWLTGQWIAGELDADAVHPGYFLPTVAGGLVGALAAAQVGLHAVAVASFGIGVVCWFVLGSVVLNRLFLRPALPPPLLPTLAIEIAPPAVGGLAWFALTGTRGDTVAYALAGYTVLMVLVQLRFVPLYRRLAFAPGFWAFTFSYASVATVATVWLALRRPPGATAYAVVILVLITGFIAAIGARTVVAAARGELLPRPAPAEPVEPVREAAEEIAGV